MQPVLQPALQSDVSLVVLVLIAALNPAVISVGWLMGSRCDQAAKLIVAGFSAALCGFALLWIGTALKLRFLADPSRAASGIFVAQFLFGTIWAWMAYKRRGR